MYSAWRLVSSLIIVTLFTPISFATPRVSDRRPSDASLLAPFRKLPNSVLAAQHYKERHDAIESLSVPAYQNLSAALVYPVMGPRKSSDYGMRKHPKLKTTRHHHGVDLAAPEGSPIRAIASGTVIYADPWGGYGNVVVVKHDDGKTTSHYGHCKSMRVKAGQHIPAGKIVGSVGSTGISTGPHLHFEVRIAGRPSNPEHFLPGLAEASAE